MSHVESATGATVSLRGLSAVAGAIGLVVLGDAGNAAAFGGSLPGTAEANRPGAA